MPDILIFAEHQDGKVKKVSLELASKATELAKESGGKVTALLIGGDAGALAPQLAPYGVSQVAAVAGPAFEKYNTIAYARAVSDAVAKLNPSILLGTASSMGRDLFPRISAKLKSGLASDCTDLRIEGGKLVAKKPVYSGKALADVLFETPIQMATTRPNSFPISVPNAGAKAEVVLIACEPGELRAPLKEVVAGAAGKVDLTEAEIIVSGGRAMANADNFKILQELAGIIGATVGASRAAVDSGFAPHEMQVGQTGKVVNPKLYIACGISGAIQHLAGMRTSKVIVAVNKDPEAQIFAKADYGLVGDLFTLVPLMSAEFKKLLAE
ncbi:MAG: electron transfer flavoprotein subunit alpha/FixB family protein [Deltaproteobacteria bacterium]|nr:electron transfer flavoprotein subunit alpha/FixB family protein [Deltaproteobacteria bacterium]